MEDRTMIDEAELEAARARSEAQQPPTPTETAPRSVETETPSPIHQAMTRAIGSTGVLVRGDEGIIWPKPPDLPAEPDEPAEPVIENEVDPADYGTSEGMLLAQGWPVPRPDLHEVVLQLEALALFLRRLKASAAQDSSLVTAALVRADVDGALHGATVNGLQKVLTEAMGADSELAAFKYQVELRFRQMLWQHRESVFLSLAGRHSPAAERLRERVRALANQPTPPTSLGMTEYLIR
jgi:hypothetical protein